MATLEEEAEKDSPGDLFPASLQNWPWTSDPRMLELPHSRAVATAAATRTPLKLGSAPHCDTSPFLTVHLRACSLFYLHLPLLDLADLFPDNICIVCYNKSEKWPVHSFRVVPIARGGCLIAEGLEAHALSWNGQPSLALVSAGTGVNAVWVHRSVDHVLMVVFWSTWLVMEPPWLWKFCFSGGTWKCVRGLWLTQWRGQER